MGRDRHAFLSDARNWRRNRAGHTNSPHHVEYPGLGFCRETSTTQILEMEDEGTREVRVDAKLVLDENTFLER